MSNTDRFLEPKSELVSIEKLLKRIIGSEWKLFLPSFQRSFVWDSEDIKSFFESIINGYPIGTILLWKPSKKDIDPFKRNFIDLTPEYETSETYYILDGQQRLTALMLLANGWKIKRGGKDIPSEPVPLSYDPFKKDLELYKGEKRGINLYRGIKDRLYTDMIESQKLRDELGKDGYSRFIEFIEKRILDYEIPVYIVRTSNESPRILSKMANIFIMVNRAGQRISNVELLLSYAAGVFDQEIASNIRQYYDDIQSKYGEEVSIQSFLRFAFSKPVLELSQQEIENVDRFKRRIEDLGRQLTIDGKKLLHERIRGALKFFSLTLDLVLDLFGLAVIDLLPSHLSLVPIACYLYVNGLSDLSRLEIREKENVKKWLLLVNFNGYYTARPSTRLEKDIEVIVESKGEFPLKDLIQNIQRNKPLATKITRDNITDGYNKDILKRPNSAYLFLLYMVLIENNATDFSGRLLKSLKHDEIAKHHIFPRKLLQEYYNIPKDVSEEDYPVKGINGLGNITLINTAENIHIYMDSPKEYLVKYSETILKEHFIPAERELWDLKKFDEFAEKRVNMIYEFLKNIYPDIVE